MSAALLRPMRWWDVEGVVAVEREVFPADPWSEAGFWSELAGVPLTRYYVVAEDDGDLVGYGGLMTVPPEADVQTVAVRSDQQGRGLGRVLVLDLLAEAARRGCATVALEVRADNAAARHLYSSLGFAEIGSRRGYYGPGADALILRRQLSRGDGAAP